MLYQNHLPVSSWLLSERHCVLRQSFARSERKCRLRHLTEKLAGKHGVDKKSRTFTA
jgi:hypothetical protein